MKLATELEGNGGVILCPAWPAWARRTGTKRRGGARALVWHAQGTRGTRCPGGDRVSGQGRVRRDGTGGGARLESLLADGGASKNDWLMQFQADVLDRPVLRSQTAELSGLGAALPPGLAAGFGLRERSKAVVARHDAFDPGLDEGERHRFVRRWNGAVAAVKAYGRAQE